MMFFPLDQVGPQLYQPRAHAAVGEPPMSEPERFPLRYRGVDAACHRPTAPRPVFILGAYPSAMHVRLDPARCIRTAPR